MIKKVILKNWRSHENTELEFSEGTNVLVGRMGSGKSSVLNAICFAFFGTFPELQSRKIKLDDIIMKKPKRKDEAFVSVEFNIGEDVWSVSRKIIREKGTYAELRKNGMLIEAPQSTRVTEAVENILKMNYELFIRAIYSEQNAIDMFLTLPKNQRREKIDELLKLDKFETARTSCLNIQKRLKVMLEEKKKTYEMLYANYDENKINSLKKENEEYENFIKNSKNELEKILSEMKKISDEANKLKIIEKNIISLEEKYKNILKQIEITNSDILKLKTKIKEISLNEIEEKLKFIKNEKNQLENQKNVLKNSIEDEQRKLDVLKRSLAKQENIFAELKQKMEEKKKYTDYLKVNNPTNINAEYIVKNDKILKIKLEISKLKSEIEQLKEIIKNLKNAKVQCPVCESPLSEKHKLEIQEKREKEIEEKNKLILENENKLKIYLSELESLEKIKNEVNLIKNKLDELSGIENKYENVFIDIENLNEKIKNLESSIKEKKLNFEVLEEQIKQKIEEIFNLSQKLESFNQLAEKENYKNNLNDSKLQIEKEIQNLKNVFDKNLLEFYENKLREYSKKSGELDTKINFYMKLINENKNRINELEKNKEIILKLENEIKKIEVGILKIEVLESSLKKVQSALRETFVKNINSVMSILWPYLYPYKDFFNARLRIDDNDYILELEDNNGWIQVDGIASGGERAIACLVVRMAFAYALAPGLNCLVLDEPTHNLDVNAINELSNVLHDRISEFIEQVFVITHEQALENAATGYLYRFERNKAENEPTKVEIVE
ncbi:MAG: AAA family ATPase [Candidatus Aenigmatarchaeota archaeon]|nr:AAA family ATPase [Candidatus Aenigmarchaeota archaeon]